MWVVLDVGAGRLQDVSSVSWDGDSGRASRVRGGRRGRTAPDVLLLLLATIATRGGGPVLGLTSLALLALAFSNGGRTLDGDETTGLGDEDETALLHADAAGVAQGLGAERTATP